MILIAFEKNVFYLQEVIYYYLHYYLYFIQHKVRLRLRFLFKLPFWYIKELSSTFEFVHNCCHEIRKSVTLNQNLLSVISRFDKLRVPISIGFKFDGISFKTETFLMLNIPNALNISNVI